jgi:D-xylonolactonase
MTEFKAECVWDLGAELGEGPVWLPQDEAVWFVDIKGHKVHRFQPSTEAKQSWDAPGQVTFLAPLADGRFLVGLKTGLHWFDPKTGAFDLMAAFEPAELDNRTNDGFVDGEGRLWFGTMHDGETNPTGALYRLGADGKPLRCDDGYVITNGPTASPDNRILYHVDTLKRVIYAFDIAQGGALENRREFVRIARSGAHPDGPVTDAEGCVWSALFGGWGLDRFSPDGQPAGRIEVPCANVTKGAFGGPDLKTLYITTAWKGMSDEERRAQPQAGGLFRVELPVGGLAQNILREGV